MPASIINTKLYIPQPCSGVVTRRRLINLLAKGQDRPLTLVSASAGFGKTTLVCDWIKDCKPSVAWLSLEEADSEPLRFMVYLVAALQTIIPDFGVGLLNNLQSTQPPPIEAMATSLLNEVNIYPRPFTLVLDDFHVIDSKPVDRMMLFLIEHLPPTMHLMIAAREDPDLPLPRLRARGMLNEIRTGDLRFTPEEAAEFLNQTAPIHLTAEQVSALETRTEGWIAGLQLAAISLQGRKDISQFIESFSGSHHFIMDYLVEEVLQQQPEPVQAFLLQTSILTRLNGPLCDAMLGGAAPHGQKMLEYLERINLFIIPLDSERRSYRYHHLFADLLKQRLYQKAEDLSLEKRPDPADLHLRASAWYENNGFDVDAFEHATQSGNIDLAARLLAGNGIPLHFRGAVGQVLKWLNSLPQETLDARPSLWVMFASALTMTGQTVGIEEKLQAAEKALQGAEMEAVNRNTIGHIAAIRALLAAYRQRVDEIIKQSQRALEYLHPDNHAVRTATIWKLGIAYHIKGDRDAAIQAYRDAITTGLKTGNSIIQFSATTMLANVYEEQTQLPLAMETYQNALKLAGDSPVQSSSEALIGMARIYYEWNKIDKVEEIVNQTLGLIQRAENTDQYVSCLILLARLNRLNETADAEAIIDKALQIAQENAFTFLIPQVVTTYISVLIKTGHLDKAFQMAESHHLDTCLARILLAKGDFSAAMDYLEVYGRTIEEKDWKNEIIRVKILTSLVDHGRGDMESAKINIIEALKMAKPGRMLRSFLDEGYPMLDLLKRVSLNGGIDGYGEQVLAAMVDTYDGGLVGKQNGQSVQTSENLVASLSARELEVLQLISQGLSNREISQKLFLALSSVKGHNQNIFNKLQVNRRTEAVAKARSLGLI